jgi:hypothetical protein
MYGRGRTVFGSNASGWAKSYSLTIWSENVSRIAFSSAGVSRFAWLRGTRSSSFASAWLKYMTRPPSRVRAG